MAGAAGHKWMVPAVAGGESSVRAAIGERGLTDVTSVPNRIRSVAHAAAVSVGTDPNQGWSRKLRRDGIRTPASVVLWTRMHACSLISSNAAPS